MNRKIIYFSLLSLLLLFTVQDACARKKKEKSAKTEIKGYENHLKDCVASDSTGVSSQVIGERNAFSLFDY